MMRLIFCFALFALASCQPVSKNINAPTSGTDGRLHPDTVLKKLDSALMAMKK